MEWKIDKNRPICPQIEEQLSVKIAGGELKPGEKLSSVREVAVSASVNPNTVQKAFEGLEAKGLLVSQRGSGWYVADSTEKATESVEKLALDKTNEYLDCMKNLGFDKKQIIKLIKGETL